MGAMPLPLLITARLTSARLPRKHLLPFEGGRCVLDYLVDRLAATGLDRVLCVPEGRNDQELVERARALEIKCFAGEPDNVLARYVEAIEHLNEPAAIIVDADDIFVCTDAIREVARCYDGQDAIFVSDLPYGGAPTLLAQDFVRRMVKTNVPNSGWAAHIDRAAERIKTIRWPAYTESERGYRLSLDYPEDLEYLRYLACGLRPDRAPLLGNVVAYITAHHTELSRMFPAQFDGSLKRRAQAHLDAPVP